MTRLREPQSRQATTVRDELSTSHEDRLLTRRQWGRFTRHYLEMAAAMGVGMLVVGGVLRAALAAVGVEYFMARFPALVIVEMAVDMSLGMAAWMRYRDHRWPRILEMSAAMLVPAIVVLPLMGLGALAAGTAMLLEHVAMFLLMLAVMCCSGNRRDPGRPAPPPSGGPRLIRRARLVRRSRSPGSGPPRPTVDSSPTEEGHPVTKAYWINTFRAISDPARSNGNSTFRRAADAIGLPAVRPHELRHTGAALAAATRASTKEPSRRTTTIRSSPSSSRRDPMGHLWITTARR